MQENPTWLCVAAAALQRADGRWLMHRRPPNKQHGGMWEFPGGKVETGESPSQALVREIAEELGVTIAVAALRPLAFAQDDPEAGSGAIVILLYTAGLWAGEPRAMEQGACIDWFTPAQIDALERPPLDRALCAQIFGRPA